MNKGGDIEAKDNPYIHDHNNLTYPCKACAFEEGHKAGEQQGIEKVVKWVAEHSTITYGRAPLKIKWQSINPVAWQAFRKGIDKEE